MEAKGRNPIGPKAKSSVERWLVEVQTWFEEHLEQMLSRLELGPGPLAEALRYPLLAGGKRLRPSLARLVCEECGGVAEDAVPAAVALELIHTYSLVHDDLPCMDDDDLRRGRPTTHKVYGEAVGVLVGDGLLTLAFETLAGHGGPQALEMVRILAQQAGPAGMVGGQALDLEAEGESSDPAAVRQIHRMKTGALIAASCELGALSANASPAVRRASRAYGEALGLCFQAVDDCLDVTGKAEELGKTPGKDEAAGKATLISTLGFEGAQAEAQARAEEARQYASDAGFAEGGLAFGLLDWLLSRRA